jgi:hypothetical protein
MHISECDVVCVVGHEKKTEQAQADGKFYLTHKMHTMTLSKLLQCRGWGATTLVDTAAARCGC